MSDAILPSSEATTIDIVDLSYGVHYKGKPIRILKHVNISFTSGQLYVVMGPSGSGKRYCILNHALFELLICVNTFYNFLFTVLYWIL